jgi:adenine-specific DNA-methyltransferase
MPRLTEQEQQEIIRYIEADKPLPDKFRFLLFEDKRAVELVWNGKTNDLCNIVMPFQVIEQVDEPRAEKPEDTALQAGLFDTRGRQLTGWTNKLIWGDNKLILSSLKNGPLREEIQKQGGLKLIYIDPPFDVGADFSMEIEIGGDTFTKKPNILEEIAYRDTWGKGADSFIAMIYERLILMRDLLAEDGSIYVHCDWRVNSFLKLVLSEIFGEAFFRNEIIWKRKGGSANPQNRLGVVTDTVLWFSKSDDIIFEQEFTKDSDEAKKYLAERFNRIDENGRRFMDSPVISPNPRPNLMYEYKGFSSPPNGWSVSKEIMELWDSQGKLLIPSDTNKRIRRKIYEDEYQGQPVQNLWSELHPVRLTPA